MRQEPGIQVPAGHATRYLMVGRVNVVRAGLEGLHFVTASSERSHDSGGDGGLTYAASDSGDYDRWGQFSLQQSNKSVQLMATEDAVANDKPLIYSRGPNEAVRALSKRDQANLPRE